MRHRLLLVALLISTASAAHAEEGMWLPEQLPALADELDTLGLELDPDVLSDLREWPLAAVVSLGGCSASFVSETGLVVTNHHCAVGALQLNSTPEANILEDGFFAETAADELWAGPGSRVYVTESLTDVTERVLSSVTSEMDDQARFDALDRAEKELVAECEIDDGYRCAVARYFGGDSFRLVRQLEIEDVRIVYAPPSMVGFYGGDDDNWMWPRHAGDFAFFRAYVAPDGTPAAHAEDNVPYEPAHHLAITTTDLDEGDFVMVAGYPHRTNRLRTGDELAHARDVTYPWNIATMEEMVAVINEVGAADEEAAVRLSGFLFGVENYLKNNRGMLDGFQASGAVERTLARDAALVESLTGSDGPESTGWEAAITELVDVIEVGRVSEERDRLLGWMGWGVDLLSIANTSLWLAHERGKPDLERDSGYQERDWPRIRERFERLDRSFVAEADRRFLAYFMRRLDELDDPTVESVVELFLSFAGDDETDDPHRAAAEAVYAQTFLIDAAERLALLEAPVEDFEHSRDPILQLAAALYPIWRERADRDEALSGASSRLRPQYIAALREFSPMLVYPDANGTLRVTYGLVRGYSPRDAVWHQSFTTVEGIVEKHRDADPFDAPDDVLSAIAEQEWGPYADPELGSVPVDFLSTLDTTGGNSGSVTFNARGELCGLLFDGNYESMGSDWVFDPVSTRSIHVSSQYMLWTLDRVDGAHRLLREMGIDPAFGGGDGAEP